jgi:hypothetical protein
MAKLFSDHLCPVDGGIVILWGHSHGSQYNGLPSIFMHDPKHNGMLIAEAPAFNILGWYPSFTQVLPFI